MKRILVRRVWLAAFAVWPLVHFGLARAYDIDTSKFGGWAALAAPTFEPNVVLFRIELRGAETFDDIQAGKISPSDWSEDLRKLHRAYVRSRTTFGRLAPPPEQLGARLLEEHGGTGMVLIAVQSRRIGRLDGRIHAEIEKYVYSDREKVRAELSGTVPP